MKAIDELSWNLKGLVLLCLGMVVVAALYETGFVQCRTGWHGFAVAALHIGIVFAVCAGYFVAKYHWWDKHRD